MPDGLPEIQMHLSVYDSSGDGCLLQDRAETGVWPASCPPQGSCLVCPRREIARLFVALVAACCVWGRPSKDRVTHFLGQEESESQAG